MQKNILAIQAQASRGDRKKVFQQIKDLLNDFCNKNHEINVDFLFLPELFSVGWDPQIFKDYAEDEQGETAEFLKKLAQIHNCYVFGGSYIRKTPDGLKNSCPIIDRSGNIIANYDKMHLFTLGGENMSVKGGDKLLMLEIEGVKIALSICYDIRFPEIYRSYIIQENKPHLFVNMSAWPKSRALDYRILSQARAIENQTYFLGLSACGYYNDYVEACGNSLFVSPGGEILKILEDKPALLFATVDTQELQEARDDFKILGDIDKLSFEVETIVV